ncbi:MAG TPA: hypothetical protein VNO70_11840 [Blastocatellia bacterium]|nr:hypothetical protein [Blastocatellia bacterium]
MKFLVHDDVMIPGVQQFQILSEAEIKCGRKIKDNENAANQQEEFPFSLQNKVRQDHCGRKLYGYSQRHRYCCRPILISRSQIQTQKQKKYNKQMRVAIMKNHHKILADREEDKEPLPSCRLEGMNHSMKNDYTASYLQSGEQIPDMRGYRVGQ